MVVVDTLTVRLVLANGDAVQALVDVAELLDELRDDLPWRPEIDEACDKLAFATKSLEVTA